MTLTIGKIYVFMITDVDFDGTPFRDKVHVHAGGFTEALNTIKKNYGWLNPEYVGEVSS